MRKARFTEEQMVAIASRCRQSPSGMASASRRSTYGASASADRAEQFDDNLPDRARVGGPGVESTSAG